MEKSAMGSSSQQDITIMSNIPGIFSSILSSAVVLRRASVSVNRKNSFTVHQAYIRPRISSMSALRFSAPVS